MTPRAPFEALLAGCGAVGSWFEDACAVGVALTCADDERVSVENLGVAAFCSADLGRDKAIVLAARRRDRGGVGRGLRGDVRYTVRPGLVRAVGCVVAGVDNPTALYDLADTLWTAGSTDVPLLVLTCGAETGGYQVRCFVPPGPCPVCLWGSVERHADRLALGTSCVDTTAPRASAAAARAAGDAGTRMLERWRSGDRSLANQRIQHDGGAGGEFTVRMPGVPSPACPIRHVPPSDDREDLDTSVLTLTVGELAARALAIVGDDAELVLGRRGVPLAGFYCPTCRKVAPAELCLLPAAEAAVAPCGCGAPRRPFGVRHSVSAVELAGSAVAGRPLASWGAGPGDEFVFVGSHGQVRLRTTFDWRDLDEPHGK
jgi:molybdopterin/thiamine biosynthesis adenylyltransferase